MALPSFDGTQDIMAWVTTLERYYREHNIPEGKKVELAMACLSRDVQACIDVLAATLEKLTEKKWVWTWMRLRTALAVMKQQVEHYAAEAEKARRKAIFKTLAFAAIGVTAIVAIPVAALGILGAIGFGAGGVAAGSLAAAIQSSIGLMEAGSLFALCQSAAAGGAAFATLVEAGFFAGAGISLAGSATAAKEWEIIQKHMPSYKWTDGDDFKPCAALILAVTQVPYDD